MKVKIVLVLIILTLSGCSPAIFNLNNFILPDDMEFMETVKKLDTPEKIGQYMESNFKYDLSQRWVLLNPYELWKAKRGVCGDFATFGEFIAGYHGYETYPVLIYFSNATYTHVITVYQENGKYNYSTNQFYFAVTADDFEEIVKHYDNYDFINEVARYEVIK